ncbi:MAG: Fur family transcriptional regulator [Thermoguttaceae bacterium]|nr:Fur family transcriptional regulator [Thermoguttaceae bacterium]
MAKMAPDQIAERLDAFETRCRQLCLPLTTQRHAVLRAVLEHHDHPTADQVLETVRDRVPGISRTTVYRALDTLVALGFVRRLHHAGPSARFDGQTHRHHHLICDKCHKVIDLQDESLDRLHISEVHAEGFQIEDFSVHFMGICRACRRSEPS